MSQSPADGRGLLLGADLGITAPEISIMTLEKHKSFPTGEETR